MSVGVQMAEFRRRCAQQLYANTKKKKTTTGSLVRSGFVRKIAIYSQGERYRQIRHSLGCHRPGRS